ncbi:hypothetical protein [Candidatus Arsenophonus triatominarum]|uniref:hypothetical protein n=1 Tax=Candidatus Arsenophonus triatominarum TaxID=57911 RepID=UPI000A67942B
MGKERQGKTSPGLPLTPEQIEFREMKKKIHRLEMENDILKKATALLISLLLNSKINYDLQKNQPLMIK